MCVHEERCDAPEISIPYRLRFVSDHSRRPRGGTSDGYPGGDPLPDRDGATTDGHAPGDRVTDPAAYGHGNRYPVANDDPRRDDQLDR